MEELNTIKTKRLKEIECKRDELERQCMVVKSFKKLCEEMKEKGTACDISRAANDLHTRSAELAKAQEQYNRQQLDRVELTITPSLTAWTRADNLIGAIDRRGRHLESGQNSDNNHEEFLDAELYISIFLSQKYQEYISRMLKTTTTMTTTTTTSTTSC